MADRSADVKVKNVVLEPLVRDVARGVITRLAPEEMPIFSVQSKAYFAHPKRALSGKKDKSGPLGFGVTEMVQLLTPVALFVASSAVQHVVGKLVDVPARRLPDVVRRIFRIAPPGEGKGAPDGEVSLTEEWWAEVHAVAEQAALREGLDAHLARRLADAIVEQGHRPPSSLK